MVSLKLRDHDAANTISEYRPAAALAAESREGGCIIGSLVIQKIQTTLRLRDSLMETADFAPMSRAVRMNYL